MTSQWVTEARADLIEPEDTNLGYQVDQFCIVLPNYFSLQNVTQRDPRAPSPNHRCIGRVS